MQISVGPTGKLIEGHLYDVNKHSFLRCAQAYDPLLYLAWNSKKRRGLGCWELRRRPEKKTAVAEGEFMGGELFSVKAVENDLINHVLDVPFLSYSTITKLKEIDTWNDKYWVDNLENKEKVEQEKIRARSIAEMRYNARQNKTIFNAFKEMVASGVNPALIAHYWGQGPQ